MGRLLSQDEIDKVFRGLKDQDEDSAAKKALVYDFRRPDRIAKDQLRSIHLLHDNFARNLASSLSGYLRAYVIVNLISVEQLGLRRVHAVPAIAHGARGDGDEAVRRERRCGAQSVAG